MNLKFKAAYKEKPGIIERILNQCYAELIKAEPGVWDAEKENWRQTDLGVFDNPDTIGACTFLSYCNDDLIGLFSFDPRPKPEYGIIGHNCILPAYRGRGFGKQQIHEIFRQLRIRNTVQCRVSTCDHWFFIPSQHMYTSCGFIKEKRVIEKNYQQIDMIHYVVNLQ